jgi:hypothetical protein
LNGTVDAGDRNQDEREQQRQRYDLFACLQCRRKFSIPNRHDESMVITPPAISTTQGIAGSLDSLSIWRTRGCSVAAALTCRRRRRLAQFSGTTIGLTEPQSGLLYTEVELAVHSIGLLAAPS